jgi:hypothetical protein
MESFEKSRTKKSTVLFASFSKEVENVLNHSSEEVLHEGKFRAVAKTEKVLEGPDHRLDYGRRLWVIFLKLDINGETKTAYGRW